jgi:uncharacterized membrane protein YedE/YeeE
MRGQVGVAAVAGRLRERFPEQSIYNMLCDVEWDVPPGQVKACGGNAMMRVDAIEQAGGYRDDLIAGEEPELCVRLRSKGWTIYVLSADMMLHDAAMVRLGQWWIRTSRGGYAFAQGVRLHGAPPERHYVRELRSVVIWAAAIPAIVGMATLMLGPWALVSLAIYPLQVARLYRSLAKRGRRPLLRASFLMLGKLPEAQGALRYGWRLLRNRQGELIEYK